MPDFADPISVKYDNRTWDIMLGPEDEACFLEALRERYGALVISPYDKWGRRSRHLPMGWDLANYGGFPGTGPDTLTSCRIAVREHGLAPLVYEKPLFDTKDEPTIAVSRYPAELSVVLFRAAICDAEQWADAAPQDWGKLQDKPDRPIMGGGCRMMVYWRCEDSAIGQRQRAFRDFVTKTIRRLTTTKRAYWWFEDGKPVATDHHGTDGLYPFRGGGGGAPRSLYCGHHALAWAGADPRRVLVDGRIPSSFDYAEPPDWKTYGLSGKPGRHYRITFGIRPLDAPPPAAVP